jgi:hypothetical protein
MSPKNSEPGPMDFENFERDVGRYHFTHPTDPALTPPTEANQTPESLPVPIHPSEFKEIPDEGHILDRRFGMIFNWWDHQARLTRGSIKTTIGGLASSIVLGSAPIDSGELRPMTLIVGFGGLLVLGLKKASDYEKRSRPSNGNRS